MSATEPTRGERGDARTETVEAPGPITLSVRNPHGDLTVRTTEQPRATVDLIATSADLLDRATVRFEGGHLTIDVIGGQVSGVRADLSGAASDKGSWSDRLSRGLRSLGGGLKRITERIDIVATLPEHSTVRATLGAGDIEATGRLAHVSVGTGGGDVRCTASAPQLRLSSGAGDVTCGAVDGTGTISTGAGDLRIEAVHGSAHLSSGAGDLSIGLLEGEAEVKNGAGSTRVDCARSGRLRARIGTGDLTVHVQEGTATRIDAQAGIGRKHIDLQAADDATAGERTLEIDVKAGVGDLHVLRAH